MNIFSRTAAVLFSLAVPLFCHGGLPSELRNMEVRDGMLAVKENGELLFDASFRGMKPDWADFENYQDKLVLKFETLHGTPAFVLRNIREAKEEEDVAWKMTTRKVMLKGTGSTLFLDISCCGSAGANTELTGKFSNRIFWYGKDGKELSSQPFCYEKNTDHFQTARLTFLIPADAVSFAVSLATDRPNIRFKEFFAVNSLRAIRADKMHPSYEKSASFISPVFSADDAGRKSIAKAGDRITLEGTFPPGTEAMIQLSAGTFQKNRLRWSPFTGPDGKKESFYRNGEGISLDHASARFLRYRLTLKGQGKPIAVREVRIGDLADGKWTVRDPLPPFVRNLTAPGEDLKKPVRLRIEADVPVLWDTLSFTIDGRYLTRHVVRKGTEITYTPDKPFYKTLHVIRLKITDAGGRKIDVKRYFDFVPMPSKNLCTLRDDGMMLIGGKPFFPLCICSMAKKPWNNYSYDEGFRQLKEAGFNLTHTYQSHRNDVFYNEFLPAAEKYGIPIYVCGPNYHNSTDILPLVNSLRDDRHHKSILVWYIADDTHLHMTAEETAEVADAVRAADPSRLVAQSDVIQGLSGYARCTDLFKLQIYPITADTPQITEKCVAQVLHDMKTVYAIRERENPTLFIWPTIQYFKGWRSWKRYPTPTELRAMTYAAVIHGACGLTWYTYGPGDHIRNSGAASTPEHWKIMTSVIKELNAIYPALCARKAKDQPEIRVVSGPVKDVLGYDSVTGLLKHADGKSFLLTVNSSMKPVKASIRLSGVKGGKVLFENRSISVKDGVLTDDFAPFAVHVYELK